MDIQRLIKEDILRILYEEGEGISPKELDEGIDAPYNSILKSIEELCLEKLIEYSSNQILNLTPKGRVKAKEIYEKHLVIENYYIENKTKTNAHNIAHLLEHYISKEVILNLNLINSFKNQGIPLLETIVGHEYFITDLKIYIGDKLFERLASMDIYPGKKIVVSAILSNCIILEIGNKKIAIDKDIANQIRAY
jgi:Mn-dependent DtxR family transcriptional regulator